MEAFEAKAVNVFNDKVTLSDIRYSYGVALQIMTPIAPITLTLSQPFNTKKGDHLKKFDFALQAIF